MKEAREQASTYLSYEEFEKIEKLKVFAVVVVCDKIYYEEV